MEPKPEEFHVPKKQKLEEDVGKLVVYNTLRNNEITGLNLPSMKLPKTLSSLLSIGYASGRDSSSSESGSSQESDCLSDNKSSPEEWSRYFTEDGHLKLDQIIPLLTPVHLSEGKLPLYKQTLQCAEYAISSYNRNNKDQYELVTPVLSNGLFSSEYFVVLHANFIAKLKNTDDAPFELFFAELVPRYIYDGSKDPVVKCCILTPHFCAAAAHHSPDNLVILHPDDVDCTWCVRNRASGNDSDSD